MPALTQDRIQLNVRVDRQAADLLEIQIARARQEGRRVTKERLVSDAILSAYGDQPESDWLPVHHGTWNPPAEASRSNAALFDWLDGLDGQPA